MYAIVLMYRKPFEVIGHENVWLPWQFKILTETIEPTKKDVIKLHGSMLKLPDDIKDFYEHRIARLNVSLSHLSWCEQHKIVFEGKFQTVYLQIVTQEQHLGLNRESTVSFLTKRQTKLVKKLKVDQIADELTSAKLYHAIHLMTSVEVDFHLKNNSTIRDIYE